MEIVVARYKADGANFLDGTPRELLPGLHYLGDHGGSAVYCLTNDRGTFLIDAPGGPSLHDFLAERFAKLDWPGKRPTAVLLTSAGELATAGLKALVERTGCSVVAPEAGAEAVRRLCPADTTFVGVAEFRKSSGVQLDAIPLAGRGGSSVAYQVTWQGKTVLLSGRLPVKVSQESVEQLFRDVGLAGAQDYLRSLDRLMHVRPDLWLPALPVHGQNANLYDEEWAEILRRNARVIMTGPDGPP
jgi:glyoxylase-like metal-dependent hydrolase (beta-lactamase superfamily II)